jgi:hypothetical protein
VDVYHTREYTVAINKKMEINKELRLIRVKKKGQKNGGLNSYSILGNFACLFHMLLVKHIYQEHDLRQLRAILISSLAYPS